jgi:hypothetical protein
MVSCGIANVTNSAFFNNSAKGNTGYPFGGAMAMVNIGLGSIDPCLIMGNSFRGKNACGYVSSLVMWTVHALFVGIIHSHARSCA